MPICDHILPACVVDVNELGLEVLVGMIKKLRGEDCGSVFSQTASHMMSLLVKALPI